MESIVQDIRYAWRTACGRPVFTGIALVSLVVGMALSAVVFSLLNAVLLRPLPVTRPSELAVLLEVRESSINHNFSYPDFTDYRAAQRSLSSMAAYSRVDVAMRTGAGSAMVAAELVSGSYFDTLGVRMRVGRPLGDADDRPGAPPAVVVTESLWRELTGRNAADRFEPKTVTLNAREFAIVGVVARPFRGMEVGRETSVWAPIHAKSVLDPTGGDDNLPRRTANWLTVVGRLAPGVTRERAAADLNVVEQGMAASAGRTRPIVLTFVEGRQGDSMLPQIAGGPLALLLGAAALVLLVGCANAANLLLSRATERTREMAVRSALGAGRLRLARVIVVDALLLAVTGAVAALLVARWLADLVAPLVAGYGEAATLDLSVDWRTLGFVAATGLVATLIAGLAPVAAVMRTQGSDSLGDGSRSVTTGLRAVRTGGALVVAQFALSLALVAAAALLARTVYNLRAIPTGFDIDHVALVSVDPEAAQLDDERVRAYLNAAIARATRVPGVRAAGFGRIIPLGFGGSRTGIAIPGYQPAPDEDMGINFNVVSPTYFDAMGIDLVDGRSFDDRDIPDRPAVALVNQTMAARYWPRGGAVGQYLTMGKDSPPVFVVGVVRDVKYRALREEAGPSFYLPLAQERARSGVIHVRTTGDPRLLLDALRRALIEVDGAVPITSVRTLRDQASRNLADERLAMMIGVTLGAAALLLAAVGLYGSMSHAITRRRREIGVRIALGATVGDIQRLVLGRGLALSLAGTVLGAGLAILLARTLEGRLFGVQAADGPTLIASAVVLGAVAIVATWAPARRATRVDPVEALRAD